MRTFWRLLCWPLHVILAMISVAGMLAEESNEALWRWHQKGGRG